LIGAMGDPSRLALSPTIVLATSADGYLAYDTDADRLHHLNPLASLIVALCDGGRDRAGVVAEVGAALGPEGRDACSAWVGEAIASGLLIEGEPPPRLRGLGQPEQLRARAEQLWAEGRVLAAYACLSRAAELKPDDAALHYRLGEAAHVVGRREESRAAYERYHALRPDDAEMAHILTALRDEAPPGRVPDRCITHLYERFAATYDRSMVEELAYRGPDLLGRAIASALGDRAGLDVLELGCGTGLAGRVLRPFAARLLGLDLSSAMLAKARRRKLYDELAEAEITAWLESDDRTLDVVAACDTLIYFGDLGQVIGPASRRLRPGGLFAMTVERGDAFPFRLTDSGRFAHHPDHLREVAAAAGLGVATLEEAVLRTEYGSDVVGLVAVLRKPPAL